MTPKKNERANLEKIRPIFLQIGLIVTLSILLAAFEWESAPLKGGLAINEQNTGLIWETPPVTFDKKPEIKPPAPVPTVLKIYEDHYNLGDDELKITDGTVKSDDLFNDMPYFEPTDEPAVVDSVFTIVENMPRYRRGDVNEFRRFVMEKIRYPEDAQANGVQGTVFVSFIIDPMGDLIQAQVVRGVHPDLDKEALRVVNLSEKWTPGKQRTKPVKVIFTMPITFHLN